MLGLSAVAWFAFGLTGKLDFDDARLLGLALLAVPLFLLGWRSLQQLDPGRRWTSVYLRVFVLFVIVALLAGFRTVQRHDELTVVALIDTSESVKRFASVPTAPDGQQLSYEQWLRGYFEQAGEGRRDNDAWGVQAFDGRPTVRSRPSPGAIKLPDGTVEQPYDGTNAQRALESGIAAKTDGNAALRMVLVSDGNFTDGDVMSAVRAAAAAGIPIDVLPLTYDIKNEVMVSAVNASPEAREGQTVTVAVELRATNAVAGQLQLNHNGQLIDLNGPETPGTGLPISEGDWRTRLDAGETEIGIFALTRYIDRPMIDTGVNNYEAFFEPTDQTAEGSNAVTANDRGEAFTLVAGQGKVLVVDGVGGDSGTILPRALAAHGIDLDVVPAGSMPRRLEDLQRYDAILLHNVAAETISPPVQERLSNYVHDLGGGFAMIGGPNSFGAGGWTNTVIDKYILPVACEIPSQTILPSGALILVLDNSGSMSGEKGHIAADAAILALQTLYPQDMVGVVAFDTHTAWVQKLQLNTNPADTAQKIKDLRPQGGTDIDAGLDASYDALRHVTMQDAAIRHVILVTDGHEQVMNPIATAARYNEAGITLTTIGIGPQNNRALLEPLANMAGGTYHSVIYPKNLPQVFIKEARTIRKNLIKEAVFDPILRNVGSPIMTGIGDVPDLRGFVLTGPKRDPRIFMPIVGPEGEPIFAHHQVGLGRAAAFTADATNRWGQDWLGWAGYVDFWGRTVRQIARPSASTQADLAVSVEGDTLVMRLDAAGDTDFSDPNRRSATFGNNLTVKGSVVGPNGSPVEVTLEQVGPGVYEARMPVSEPGNYIADLQMIGRGENAERRRVIAGTSKRAGDELRSFQSNLAVLKEIAEMTGGRVLDPKDPAAAGLYDRTMPFESVSTRPLRWSLMPWLLLLVLLDVACRRIAWEPAEIGAWAKGRANAVLGIMSARQPSETQAQTMAALKAKRAAMDQAAAEQAKPADTPARARRPGRAHEGPRRRGRRINPRQAQTRRHDLAHPQVRRQRRRPGQGQRRLHLGRGRCQGRRKRQAHRHRRHAQERQAPGSGPNDITPPRRQTPGAGAVEGQRRFVIGTADERR